MRMHRIARFPRNDVVYLKFQLEHWESAFLLAWWGQMGQGTKTEMTGITMPWNEWACMHTCIHDEGG
jgi:hypothetical protein